MATKLKDMKLTSVDLVRAGANQEADICLFKGMDPEGQDDVGKASFTFDQVTDIRDKQEKLWHYSSALTDSISSIQDDNDLGNEGKARMMRESLQQFTAAMEGLICELCGTAPVKNEVPVTVGKSDPDRFDHIQEVQKFNPYHGPDGRFTSAGGGASFTYAPGKSRAHDKAIRREMTKEESANFGNSDSKSFASAVGKARESCAEDKRWRVTAHTQEELENDYPGAKLHVTKGGSTVAVTKDGDIISVCGAKGDKLRGSDLMQIAVENGGKKLDSFSGNHDFYTRNGFEPVSWTPFNETYAPDGWRKGVDKPEPVVFYKYKGGKVNMPLDKFLKNTKPFEGDDGYDQAMKFRDSSMEG